MAVSLVTERGSESDVGGNDATQLIGAGLSSHPKVSAYDCKPGWSEDIQSAYLAEALQYRPKLIMGLLDLFMVITSVSVADPRPKALDQLSETFRALSARAKDNSIQNK